MRRRTLGAAVAVAVAAVSFAPAATAAPGAPEVGVIVRELQAASPAAELAVARLGGSVDRQLPIVEGFAATLPADRVAELAASPAVADVTPDAEVRLHSAYDPVLDTGSLYSSASIVQAWPAWSKGATGKGVDVALIDSGVAPVTGLDAPGKVVRAVDLSFDSQDAAAAADGFGHGTHMAGIIAGRDDAGYLNGNLRTTGYYGIAPEARIVSVKVADRNGATDVSQLLAGIDWVVRNQDAGGLDIRVLNLSVGTESLQGYELDPLAHAAEVAWRSGIVVVVSAGNNGDATGQLNSPAYNPRLIAVGADDTLGTNGIADDVIPDWSSKGDGIRNPDLVAPGRGILGLRSPGSLIDVEFPQGRVADRYFRGSGSSQAAAMVSGVVAGLLSARPELDPDQVKDLLVRTANRLPAASPTGQGAGLVDFGAALQRSAGTATQGFAPTKGTGTLEASRGGSNLVDQSTGKVLKGELDIFGRPFNSSTWASKATAGTTWTGGAWNGSTWTGSYDGTSWASVRWSSKAWSGATWDSVRWSGIRWSSVRWSSVRWSSVRWSSVRWG